MRNNIVLYVALLLCALGSISVAIADNSSVATIVAGTPPVAASDAVTKFMSAELAKDMNQQTTDIVKAVNSYNDENFMAFDGQVKQYLADAKMKMMLASAGVSLIVIAIAVLFMMRYFKNYSYEKYQEKLLGKMQKEAEGDSNGLKDLRQNEWNVQQTKDSVSMAYGQEQAAQMSQMNAWQAQPAYGGGWKSPTETIPEFDRVPNGYYQDSNIPGPEGDPVQSSTDTEDPMESPGWSPRKGGY